MMACSPELPPVGQFFLYGDGDPFVILSKQK